MIYIDESALDYTNGHGTGDSPIPFQAALQYWMHPQEVDVLCFVALSPEYLSRGTSHGLKDPINDPMLAILNIMMRVVVVYNDNSDFVIVLLCQDAIDLTPFLPRAKRNKYSNIKDHVRLINNKLFSSL